MKTRLRAAVIRIKTPVDMIDRLHLIRAYRDYSGDPYLPHVDRIYQGTYCKMAPTTKTIG